MTPIRVSILCIVSCLCTSSAQTLSAEPNEALQPIRRAKQVDRSEKTPVRRATVALEDATHRAEDVDRRAMALEDVTHAEGDDVEKGHASAEGSASEYNEYWVLIPLLLIMFIVLACFFGPIAYLVWILLTMLVTACSSLPAEGEGEPDEGERAEGEPAAGVGAPIVAASCYSCLALTMPSAIILFWLSILYGITMIVRWGLEGYSVFQVALHSVEKELQCTTACHEIRQFEKAVDLIKTVLIPCTLLYFWCGAFVICGSVTFVKLLKFSWGAVLLVELSLLSLILGTAFKDGSNLGLEFSNSASTLVFLYLFIGPIFSLLIYTALSSMEPAADEASEVQDGAAPQGSEEEPKKSEEGETAS